MKHILKAEEGEQIKKAKTWYLTIYDDETFNIYETTEFQIMEEER